MRLELSQGGWIYGACATILGLYVSPFFRSGNADDAWEFLSIWDDRANFLENEAIQHGLNWKSIYEMFTMTKINVYEPFGWILKAVVVQIAGLDSWSVRIVSVLLHFAAGFVLAKASALLLDMVSELSNFKWGLTRKEELVRRERRRHWYCCCLSAVLFLIHPLNVETVSWPSAQPYTLCALFSNLALYVYIRAMYRKVCGLSSKKDAKPLLFSSVFGQDRERDLLCCALYFGALMSKSVCILLPASFLMIDTLVFAFLRPPLSKITARQLWTYFVGKVPTAAVLLAFLSITLTSNRLGAHGDADVLSLSLNERVVKALTTPAWILQHILWPTKLRPHYQLRPGELDIANPEYQLLIVASLVVTLFTVWLLEHRHEPQHLFALASFVLMVLPVSGLIQHGMVCAGFDRYAYLSTIVAVPYGGAALARWFLDDDGLDVEPEHSPRRDSRSQSRLNHRTGVALVVLVILSGTFLSISTGLMDHWRNEDVLFQYSLRMDPSDWRLLDQRAANLLKSGRCSQDDTECRQLWDLSYHFTPKGTLKSDLHRLKILASMGDVDRACEAYMKLVELHPHSCHAHNNVGVCWVYRGEFDHAQKEFEHAAQNLGCVDSLPRLNLNGFLKWLALKEEVQARGGTEQVPQFHGLIMF